MYRIGIDIGGTKVNIGIIDENYDILDSVSGKLPQDKSPSSVTEFVSEMIKNLKPEYVEKAESIGIGIPGTVSSDGKTALKVPNMGWQNVNLAERFEKLLHMPVTLVQDSRAAAYGEYMAGAGKGAGVVVCVTLGTGIGTGIIIDGSIYNGPLGAAGELGHLPFGNEGRKCGCGRVDCLECYAAGKGIETSAMKYMNKDISCSEVFELAKSGDETALKIINDACVMLGKAMVAIINLLSPDALLFSGGISRQEELFVNPLIDYIKNHCYISDNKIPYIGAASLGADSPMIGAALVPETSKVRRKEISVSMMCADMLHLEDEVRRLEKAGAGYFHFDVMDGHFVPNLMLPAEMINQIKKITDVPFDIHLMTENPENYIDMYDLTENDIVSVHYESTHHIQRALSLIKKSGAKAALALNPGTPVECVRDLLDDIDMILIMTVNPGFAGQKLVPQCLDKIKRTRMFLDGQGYKDILIETDGNCSFENISKMKKSGADMFVAGTSSIFNADIGIEKAMDMLGEILDKQ